jgi:hypothetical protein
MGVGQSRTAAGREPRPDREDRLIDTEPVRRALELAGFRARTVVIES